MSVSGKDRLAAIQRAEGRCQECGRPGETIEGGYWIDLEVDHIQQIAHGGGNEPDNLRVLCIQCHAARHRRRLPEGPIARRRGERYPCRVFLYVGEDEKRLLERLARKRDLSESALIRQMIRELARKEGVD